MESQGASTSGSRRFRAREERGAELVEGALVSVFLFSMLLGIVWLGRGYNIYATITRAAREGARYAVAPSCYTCGNAYPSDTQVREVVDGALRASSLSPAAVSDFAVTVIDPLIPGSYPPQTGVRISFRYPVELALPFAPRALTRLTIPTQVQVLREKL